MVQLNDARKRWLWLTAAIPLLTSCASLSLRAQSGALRLVQVEAVATRQEIIAKGLYDKLIASGIHDADVRDGSLAAGRIYCCGPRPNMAFFYIPAGMEVKVGDIVEVKTGDGSPRGLNIATQVRHSGADAKDHCRWDPPNEYLWMRILYCDWMEKEGWVHQEGWGYKRWVKPAPATGEQ